MEPFWIDVIAAVLAIALIVVFFVVRHRLRANDYHPKVDPADRPDSSQDARIETARRFSDRTGFGAGGGV